MTQRAFQVIGSDLTVGTGTLIFINPPAAPKPALEFMRYWAGQAGTTTSTQQKVQLFEGTVGGTAPTLTSATPVSLHTGDATASIIVGGTAGAAGTAGVNASVQGNGSNTIWHADDFNILTGWLYVPTPEERKIFVAGYTKGNGVLFPTVPASTANWSFGCSYAEK